MAKMGGCNDNVAKNNKPQAPGRMNPANFNRKNMAKGGVNNQMKGKK